METESFFPCWSHFVHKFVSEYSRSSRIPAETVPLSDPISATRVLCGALILPTIATIVGKLMFGSVQSNFQRTLLVSHLPQLATLGFLFSQPYRVHYLMFNALSTVRVTLGQNELCQITGLIHCP